MACQALLCLAAVGTRPSECLPSITHYFSIKLSRPWRTLRARLNFLRLCPTGDAGVTAQTIQDNYGSCGVGAYDSATCHQVGYTGQTIAGFCDSLVGSRCEIFTPGPYWTEEGEVAGTGTYGLCLRVRVGGPSIFEEPEIFDELDGGCTRFTEDTPFSYPAAELASAD